MFFLVFNSFVLKAFTIDSRINSHFNVTAFADEDGDGVEDEDDSCAGTPAGETVDAVNANTSTSIAVDSNSAYSWKIIAVDTNGNKSNSGVYSFRTN